MILGRLTTSQHFSGVLLSENIVLIFLYERQQLRGGGVGGGGWDTPEVLFFWSPASKAKKISSSRYCCPLFKRWFAFQSSSAVERSITFV